MRVIIKLVCAIFCGACLVAFLFFHAELPNRRMNGFRRHFYKATSQLISETSLSPSVTGIAGISRDSIYLFTTSVNCLLRSNISLNEIEAFSLSLDQALIDRIGSVFYTQASAKYAFIFAKNLPGVIRIEKYAVKPEVFMNKRVFSSGVVLSKNTFVLRQLDDTQEDMQFIKFGAYEEKAETENSMSLIVEDIGRLGGDGQLHYDNSTQTFTYVHYYYNAVLTFDTLLNSVRQFMTIDTIEHFSRNRGVPLVINQKSCVSNGVLFICSNLKADNETNKGYWTNIPIDLYQVKTGSYLGSFYIPLVDGKLIKSIYVKDNILAALFHSNKLKVYSIHRILQAQEPSAVLLQDQGRTY